jgi:hypothetical protein
LTSSRPHPVWTSRTLRHTGATSRPARTLLLSRVMVSSIVLR